MIDPTQPIVPAKSLGGLSVGSALATVYDAIKDDAYEGDIEITMDEPFFITYACEKSVRFEVHVLNGKILKISATEGYTGATPRGIRIGMTLADAQKAEPGLFYDEAEEIFRIKDSPGISLDASDPKAKRRVITAITIYHPALDDWTEQNARGEW